VQVPAAGWTQWFLFIGLIEKGLYTYDPTRSPGDYKNAGAGWLACCLVVLFLLEVILKKAFEKSFCFFTIKRCGGRLWVVRKKKISERSKATTSLPGSQSRKTSKARTGKQHNFWFWVFTSFDSI